MNKSQIKKLIQEGYNRMYLISNKDWRDYRQEMLDSELKAERQHRSINPNDRPIYLNSATLSAKYFCIKFMLNAFHNPTIKPSDVLYSKRSSLIAKGCFDYWGNELIEAFRGFDLDAFNHLGYEQGGIVYNGKGSV